MILARGLLPDCGVGRRHADIAFRIMMHLGEFEDIGMRFEQHENLCAAYNKRIIARQRQRARQIMRDFGGLRGPVAARQDDVAASGQT